MPSSSVSHNIKIPIKDFVKKVMRPATKKSEKHIMAKYDPTHRVRTEYSYGSFKGNEVLDALNQYPGKLDTSVALQRIEDIAIAQGRVKARGMENAFNTGDHQNERTRGEQKKAEIEQMRLELEREQQTKMSKYAAKREKQKIKRNIERNKESAEDMRLQDLAID